MTNTRLSMRKIKDVLRLTHGGHLNTRHVALTLIISLNYLELYNGYFHSPRINLFIPQYFVYQLN